MLLLRIAASLFLSISATQAHSNTILDLFPGETGVCQFLRHKMMGLSQKKSTAQELYRLDRKETIPIEFHEDLEGNLEIEISSYETEKYRLVQARPIYSVFNPLLTIFRSSNALGIKIPRTPMVNETMQAVRDRPELYREVVKRGTAEAKSGMEKYSQMVREWQEAYLNESNWSSSFKSELRKRAQDFIPFSEWYVVYNKETGEIVSTLRMLVSHFGMMVKGTDLHKGQVVSNKSRPTKLCRVGGCDPNNILRTEQEDWDGNPVGKTNRIGVSPSRPFPLLVETSMRVELERLGRVSHIWIEEKTGELNGFAVGIIAEPGSWSVSSSAANDIPFQIALSALLNSALYVPSPDTQLEYNQYFDVPKILYTFSTGKTKLYSRRYGFRNVDPLEIKDPKVLEELAERMGGPIQLLAATPQTLAESTGMREGGDEKLTIWDGLQQLESMRPKTKLLDGMEPFSAQFQEFGTTDREQKRKK